MRTMFVNPTKRRKKARKNPKRRSVSHAPRAPRRHRRARRRNAGITPFVSSASLVPNPRRRRSLARRHNPLSSPKKLVEETFINLGGAGIGVAANYFAINRIENVWARNGARVAAAIGAGMMIPGRLGAATAGAVMYPAVLELVDHFAPKGWGEKEADLDMLSADLEALLNVP